LYFGEEIPEVCFILVQKILFIDRVQEVIDEVQERIAHFGGMDMDLRF